MIVVEGNSQKQPCSRLTKQEGMMVVTTKIPTENTDYYCARHVKYRLGREHYPFMCYKWMEPNRFPDLQDAWVADHEYWDKYFRSFNPKFPDPSSGTCAVFCAVERWGPSEIGLIGFDWVLDTNSDWFHDAEAELKAIQQLTKIIDLRNNNDTNIRRFRPERGVCIPRL